MCVCVAREWSYNNNYCNGLSWLIIRNCQLRVDRGPSSLFTAVCQGGAQQVLLLSKCIGNKQQLLPIFGGHSTRNYEYMCLSNLSSASISRAHSAQHGNPRTVGAQ